MHPRFFERWFCSAGGWPCSIGCDEWRPWEGASTWENVSTLTVSDNNVGDINFVQGGVSKWL